MPRPFAQPPANPDWPEAMATVLSCTYTARAGRAIAFGLPSNKHFRIAYNYWAGDSLQTGEFFAEAPVPQGSVFPIHYDPDQPHQNRQGGAAPANRGPLLALGIAGSVVLSLAWFLVLRGCQ